MVGFKTLFGCLVFVVLWSSGWIGAKYGQDYAGTFTLLAYRYALVVVLLFIFVSATKSWRHVPPSQFLFHVCVGILSHAVYLGAGNSALLLGVSAGMVAFITALQPMITATMSSSVSGERASYRQWIGLALGLGAIVVVISDKIALGGSFFAYSLPFFAVLALSLASVMDRRISLQNQAANLEATPLSLVTLIHCTSALFVMVPFAIVLEDFEAQWGRELIFSILWLALVVSLGAYGMMFFMLRMISAIKVASLEYLAPPTTMIIAYFMFDETLSTVDIVGMVLAGFAVWLVISKKKLSTEVGTVNTYTDPILRPPVFKAQGLRSDTGLDNKVFLSSPALDIELDAHLHSSRIANASQEQREPNDVRALEQQMREMEKILEDRNLEIHRLNQVWEKLHDSQNEIKTLNSALAAAENEKNEQRLRDIELSYLSERLNAIVLKQGSHEVDNVSQIEVAKAQKPVVRTGDEKSGNSKSQTAPENAKGKPEAKKFSDGDSTQEFPGLPASLCNVTRDGCHT